MIIQKNMVIYAHVKSASIVSCTVDLSLDFLTALILQTHVTVKIHGILCMHKTLKNGCPYPRWNYCIKHNKCTLANICPLLNYTVYQGVFFLAAELALRKKILLTDRRAIVPPIVKTVYL